MPYIYTQEDWRRVQQQATGAAPVQPPAAPPPTHDNFAPPFLRRNLRATITTSLHNLLEAQDQGVQQINTHIPDPRERAPSSLLDPPSPSASSTGSTGSTGSSSSSTRPSSSSSSFSHSSAPSPTLSTEDIQRLTEVLLGLTSEVQAQKRAIYALQDRISEMGVKIEIGEQRAQAAERRVRELVVRVEEMEEEVYGEEGER